MAATAHRDGSIENMWFDPAIQTFVARIWPYHQFVDNPKLFEDPQSHCALCHASESVHWQAWENAGKPPLMTDPV